MWFDKSCQRASCPRKECDYQKYLEPYSTYEKEYKEKCPKCININSETYIHFGKYNNWSKQDGRDWLETNDGQSWLSSADGHKYVHSKIPFGSHAPEYFTKWIASQGGFDWLTKTEEGKKIFDSVHFTNFLNYYRYDHGEITRNFDGSNCQRIIRSNVAYQYLSTDTFHKWILNNPHFLIGVTNFLEVKPGKEWIKSNYGFSLLTSELSYGRNKHECMKKVYIWLVSDDGQEWLSTENGQKFLGTPGGFAFLLEKGGTKCIEKNISWLQTNDGRRFKKYIESCTRNDSDFMITEFAKIIYERGFEDYFFPNTTPMIAAPAQSSLSSIVGYVVGSVAS